MNSKSCLSIIWRVYQLCNRLNRYKHMPWWIARLIFECDYISGDLQLYCIVWHRLLCYFRSFFGIRKTDVMKITSTNYVFWHFFDDKFLVCFNSDYKYLTLLYCFSIYEYYNKCTTFVWSFQQDLKDFPIYSIQKGTARIELILKTITATKDFLSLYMIDLFLKLRLEQFFDDHVISTVTNTSW